MSTPEQSASPYASPSATSPFGAPGQAAAATAQQGDHTGGVIPYKNPKALIAYYLGVFSLIPILGAPLALIAIVLGILGLRDKKANPIIRGTAHAWVGIVLGSLVTGAYLLVIALMVVGRFASR